ncbi:MAG TPA: hypothetical protein VMG34_07025 [Bacteroidota bacterium]|nr:hypothetical protein [Bacteroidota bacterium]
MNRFLLLVFVGGGLLSTSMAQVAPRDSSAAADTVKKPVAFDTTAKLPLASDTLAKRQPDTLGARLDTTALKVATPIDTAAGKADNSVRDTTQKKAAIPGLESLPTTVASLDPNGYRGARWGTPLKDVHDYLVDHDNVDEYEILDMANGFEFDGSVAGTKCRLAYQFDNDRLFAVRLTPKVSATTKFDFLDSFDEYESTLEAKYGKPTRSGFHKVDESYLNTIESIQLGFAKKYALWEFERSYIVLILLGHKGQLELHLTYLSKAIFDEMSNRIESLRLEDF